MQSNAVRFIHTRRQFIAYDKSNPFFNRIEKAQTGGMTFAWKVTDEGNIHVSQPAVCRNDDNYVRAAGAQYASMNLIDKDVLFCVTKDELIENSIEVYKDALTRIGDLNQAAVVQMVSLYRNELNLGSIVRHMTPRFFEEAIREKLRSMYKVGYAI